MPVLAKHNDEQNSNPTKNRSGSGRPRFWLAGNAQLLVFTILMTLILGSIMAFQLRPNEVAFEAGQVANTTVKAPVKIRFVSNALTQEARQQAASDPGNVVYNRDPAVAHQSQESLTALLEQVQRVRQDTALSFSQKANRIRVINGISLGDDAARQIASLSDQDWQRVRAESSRVLGRLMEQPIYVDDLEARRASVPDFVSRDMASVAVNSVVAITQPFVRSTMVFNAEETLRRQDEARSSVRPVYVDVEQGQVIIRDGEIVKPADIEKLEALGLREPTMGLGEIAGTYGFVALLMMSLFLYLQYFGEQIRIRRKLLLMLGIVMALTILAAKFAIPGHAVIAYIFPVATVSMLFAVLLDVRLAVVATVIIGLLVGQLADGSLEMSVVSISSGITGAFAIWKAERSTNFVLAGLFVAVVTFVAVVSMRLISGVYDTAGIAALAGASALNGGLAASLTFAAFSVMGNIFGITTVLQLLELAHPNQPLLRRLMREAPGTYHHSIVVSNLAEQAAELIGGDPLLVRVGAFYHDIGKVNRPYFFVENQANRENIHDNLDPQTSARIISGHVLDGVALAEKSRLPHKVIDIIRQHHGDGYVGYFYHRAKEEQMEVNAEDFRYQGPKPQTKEAALIMLADSVEASVRAASQSGKLEVGNGVPLLGDKSPMSEAISDRVRQVVQARLDEGQLDDADITLRDLELIRNTFVAILEGIYHPRIEYPSAGQQEVVPDNSQVAPIQRG